MPAEYSHEKAQYLDCYVAYIDILGMSERVLASKDATDLVMEIADVLLQAARVDSERVSTTWTDKVTGEKYARHWITQIRAFSDSVVLFVPVESLRLNDLLQRVIYLHDRFLRKGFCLRGAITIGKMYWDPQWCVPDAKETTLPQEREIETRVTFGPGLVEAYKLESQVAVYPRLIISPALLAVLKSYPEMPLQLQVNAVGKMSHIPMPELGSYGDVLNLLRLDSDCIPFLDPFKIASRMTFIQTENAETGKRDTMVRVISKAEFLANVRERLMSCLAEAKVPKVRVKWMWLVQYFNSSLSPEDGVDPIPIHWESPSE